MPCLLFLLMLVQQGFAQPVDRPNFVFLIAEDCSKHHFALFDENGTATPNIRDLAEEGLLYRHAFSNSPVCSVARTTLMTGCYPTVIGSHHHRTAPRVALPKDMKMFSALLREGGYYTTNKVKTDYNVSGGGQPWDESSRKATWRNRGNDQPFFHMQSFPISHEGSLHFPVSDIREKQIEDLESVFVQPRHPDTELFRYTRARYHQQIRKMDRQVGDVVRQLESDGLLDDTFVFFFGDHGGVLPGTKGYLFETGLHVPLVIRVPQRFRDDVDLNPGSSVSRHVSFVDFGPTLLHLAGLDMAESMTGRPFLGLDLTDGKPTDVSYGFADRFDERMGRVRSVRKDKYKYIRNYQPWYFDGLQNNYRYRMAAWQQWREQFESDGLNETQSLFFNTAPVEQLYDLSADPYETTNLAGNSDLDDVLQEMRGLLRRHQNEFPDLGFYPESFLRESPQITEPLRSFGDSRRDELKILQRVSDYSLGGNELVNCTALAKSIDLSESNHIRYTAITAGLAGNMQDGGLLQSIENVLSEEDCRFVRLRAIEYLALVADQDPRSEILKLLSESDKPFESAEILNAIATLRTGEKRFEIPVDAESVHPAVRDDKNVQRRLEFLAE